MILEVDAGPWDTETFRVLMVLKQCLCINSRFEFEYDVLHNYIKSKTEQATWI